MSAVRILISMLLFNGAWFVCVAFRMPWALLAAAIAIGAHLIFLRPHRCEWRAAVVVALIGIAVDSVLTIVGVFDFVETWSGPMGQMLVPLWFMALWLTFGATLNTAMRFFAQHPVLAVIAGMLAGPSAYFAGHSLGAVEFGFSTTTALLIVAAVWGVLFPTVVNIAGAVGEVDDAATRF